MWCGSILSPDRKRPVQEDACGGRASDAVDPYPSPSEPPRERGVTTPVDNAEPVRPSVRPDGPTAPGRTRTFAPGKPTADRGRRTADGDVRILHNRHAVRSVTATGRDGAGLFGVTRIRRCRTGPSAIRSADFPSDRHVVRVGWGAGCGAGQANGAVSSSSSVSRARQTNKSRPVNRKTKKFKDGPGKTHTLVGGGSHASTA